MRSGTLPTALCVGFGEALAIAMAGREAEAEKLLGLRNRLLDGICARISGVTVNGALDARIPGNLNLSFAGINSETLMMELRDLALSTGSACSSESLEPSYVLDALGVDAAMARASIRIGIGRFTTSAEIDHAVSSFAEKVEKLRRAATAPALAPAAAPAG